MNISSSLQIEQTHRAERKIVMDVRDITKSLPLGRERIEF